MKPLSKVVNHCAFLSKISVTSLPVRTIGEPFLKNIEILNPKSETNSKHEFSNFQNNAIEH